MSVDWKPRQVFGIWLGIWASVYQNFERTLSKAKFILLLLCFTYSLTAVASFSRIENIKEDGGSKVQFIMVQKAQ